MNQNRGSARRQIEKWSASGVEQGPTLAGWWKSGVCLLDCLDDFEAFELWVAKVKWGVAVPDVADILAAIDLHRLHKFSFWDALVIRSAKQSGCTVLFSEDMQHTRDIDGLQIVNPFK